MKKPAESRRTFLKKTVIAAPLVLSAKTLARGAGHVSPNERVRIGLIGCGGRSRAVVGAGLEWPEFQMVAVADCFEPKTREVLDHFKADWKAYTDFREMIEKENLDGVAIETTTHARAWITIQVLQMGVDAYIEKPMCLTIEEGRAMVDAAKKYQCVTQVGTQQRSMPLNNWACDLIQAGAIGKVKTVLAPNFIGPDPWVDKPAQPMPEGGPDGWWNVWTNSAPLRPYNGWIHRGWQYWDDYDGGGRCFGLTGWGTHSYDQVQRGLGTCETGPVEILLEEAVETMESGKFEQREIGEDETGRQYYRAAKLIGPRAKVRMWYADGVELRLHLDGDRGPGLGCIFVGEEGKIEVNRDRITSNPKELVLGDERPKTVSQLGVSETAPHVKNWIDCIKTRQRATADIAIGHRSTTICNLVNVVRELGHVGERLKWDPEAERFTNCDEANQNRWMARPRRKGYELPKIG